MRTLLKIGGSVHAKTNRGETPLHLAAQKTSSIQVMRQLINAGANVNATDNDKRTPIYYATVNSQADDHRKLSTLLSQPSINVDQCTTLGVTPLYTAITEGSPSGSQQTDRQRLFNQRAKLLLTKTEKIDQRFPKNEDNTTLLMHAIKHGNNEMATALINEGANIHIQNDLGLDALKIAIQQKNQEMVELLLDKGASIYAKDKQGKTALHHAAANPNISCAQMVDVVKNQSFAMRWLYSEKWYINQTDNDDQSALHIAYEKGNRNAVTLLTRNGADETLIDAYGNTPAENKPLRS